MFSCEICENFKNTFFRERLWATASVFYSTFINTLLKAALKNLKRMLSLHFFDEFFCFLNWFSGVKIAIGHQIFPTEFADKT